MTDRPRSPLQSDAPSDSRSDARSDAQEISAMSDAPPRPWSKAQESRPWSKAQELWSRVPPALRLPLVVFLSCQACYLIWWMAFYPGLISYDSLAYTWQVTTDHWNSNFSVLYNSLLWLSLMGTGGFGALTLFQSLAMSATLAYTCAGLRDIGVRGRWSAPAALACAVAPPLASFTVYVSKDVPFTICAILVFAVTVRLTGRRLRGTWSGRLYRSELLLLCVGFFGLSLFRNNGFPVAVLAALCLVLVLPGARRVIAALVTVTTSVALALMLYGYEAVGVEKPPTALLYNLHYADISVTYAQAPELFTKSDLQLMAKAAPLSEWSSAGAKCFVSDPIYRAVKGQIDDQLAEPLSQLWARTLHKSPHHVLGARLCRGHIAWAVFPGPADQGGRTINALDSVDPAAFYKWYPEMKTSPYNAAAQPQPVSERLRDVAYFAYEAAHVPQLEWLLWRGAIWCYATYAIVTRLARSRRCRPLFALAGVTLGTQLTVLIATPSPTFRYMAAPIFIGLLCLSLIPALRGAVRPVVPPRASPEEPSWGPSKGKVYMP
ncbi:hypothetical protein [Streptomyces boluensis]|uniref:Uncharacterized protein n=1 Tax=Streptomyces boluensis TaxID=1775135 RepID=A0A964XK16_9ACTN|nr:hypothetical protein [Streptomyces boluensis]NBE50242.1 hypothetical protein [Streptomyces boluensis]